MPIRFRCDHCRQLLSISSRQAGKTVECPTCRAAIGVPERSEPALPLEAAPMAEAAGGEIDLDEEQGFRLRRPQTEFDEMDLTPMVDVTFLLLIFFMITAAFSMQKTIDVPPPDPDQQGAAQSLQRLEDLQRNAVIVQIDELNAISIDDENLDDRARLAEALRDKLVLEHKTELVIDVDPRALHETFVAVIDAANESNYQKIRIATRRARGED